MRPLPSDRCGEGRRAHQLGPRPRSPRRGSAKPTAGRLPRPDDDYLLALAIRQRAYLVTGDQDLLVLSDDVPILTPAQFAAKLRESR
jgi:hypothetical protein